MIHYRTQDLASLRHGIFPLHHRVLVVFIYGREWLVFRVCDLAYKQIHEYQHKDDDLVYHFDIVVFVFLIHSILLYRFLSHRNNVHDLLCKS